MPSSPAKERLLCTPSPAPQRSPSPSSADSANGFERKSPLSYEPSSKRRKTDVEPVKPEKQDAVMVSEREGAVPTTLSPPVEAVVSEPELIPESKYGIPHPLSSAKLRDQLRLLLHDPSLDALSWYDISASWEDAATANNEGDLSICFRHYKIHPEGSKLPPEQVDNTIVNLHFPLTTTDGRRLKTIYVSVPQPPEGYYSQEEIDREVEKADRSDSFWHSDTGSYALNSPWMQSLIRKLFQEEHGYDQMVQNAIKFMENNSTHHSLEDPLIAAFSRSQHPRDTLMNFSAWDFVNVLLAPILGVPTTCVELQCPVSSSDLPTIEEQENQIAEDRLKVEKLTSRLNEYLGLFEEECENNKKAIQGFFDEQKAQVQNYIDDFAADAAFLRYNGDTLAAADFERRIEGLKGAIESLPKSSGDMIEIFRAHIRGWVERERDALTEDSVVPAIDRRETQAEYRKKREAAITRLNETKFGAGPHSIETSVEATVGSGRNPEFGSEWLPIPARLSLRLLDSNPREVRCRVITGYDRERILPSDLRAGPAKYRADEMFVNWRRLPRDTNIKLEGIDVKEAFLNDDLSGVLDLLVRHVCYLKSENLGSIQSLLLKSISGNEISFKQKRFDDAATIAVQVPLMRQHQETIATLAVATLKPIEAEKHLSLNNVAEIFTCD